MAVSALVGLGVQVAPMAIEKLLGQIGKNKQAAALLLRIQESDLASMAQTLEAMCKSNEPVNKEMLMFITGFIRRGADIADKAADILVGEDDR